MPKSEKINLLFLSTGNSCRSQMGEGWVRHLKNDLIDVWSAGVETHGVNSKTIKVMAESGVDISGYSSELVHDLLHIPFDYVITVCDHAAEACPVFPGRNTKVIHKGFDDPPKLAQTAKTEEEALGFYRRVRDQIKEFAKTARSI